MLRVELLDCILFSNDFRFHFWGFLSERVVFKRKISLPFTIATLWVVFASVTIWKARSHHLPAGLPARPILELTSQTIDLGVLSGEQRVDVPFRFSNSGGHRIQIHEVDQQSGCGETIRRSMTLGPRDSRDWIVSFEPGFAVGYTESITRFITSDPALPRFKLKVVANIKPTVSRLDCSLSGQEVASVLNNNFQTAAQ